MLPRVAHAGRFSLPSLRCVRHSQPSAPPSHHLSIQNPLPNAYTLAIAGRKPFIVLHTALLDLLTPEEVQVGGRGGGWGRRRVGEEECGGRRWVGQQANKTGLLEEAQPRCLNVLMPLNVLVGCLCLSNGGAALPCWIACWVGKLARGYRCGVDTCCAMTLMCCRRCWHTSWAT